MSLRIKTELNDLKKYLIEKILSSAERILGCNVIENLAEHGMYCLSAMLLYQ